MIRRMRLLLRRPAFLFVSFFCLAWLSDRAGALPTCWLTPHGTRKIEVVRVLDGDTIEDACGYRLRLVGVDTPEKDTPWGPAAAEFTRTWLAAAGDDLRVSYCRPAPEDRYGRRLGRLHLRNGEHLATALLAAGRAYPLHMAPCGTPWQVGDLAAFHAAREARRGQWAHWDEAPRDVRRAIAERGWLQVAGTPTSRYDEVDRSTIRLRGGRGLRVEFYGDAITRAPAVGQPVTLEGWIGAKGPAVMRIRDPRAVVSAWSPSGSSGKAPRR